VFAPFPSEVFAKPTQARQISNNSRFGLLDRQATTKQLALSEPYRTNTFFGKAKKVARSEPPGAAYCETTNLESALGNFCAASVGTSSLKISDGFNRAL
jgi:hypothetical protein